MLKSASIHFETQADTLPHVSEYCSQHGRSYCSNFDSKISSQIINSARFVSEHPTLQQTAGRSPVESCLQTEARSAFEINPPPKKLLIFPQLGYLWHTV
jgi:hypothetical protein